MLTDPLAINSREIGKGLQKDVRETFCIKKGSYGAERSSRGPIYRPARSCGKLVFDTRLGFPRGNRNSTGVVRVAYFRFSLPNSHEIDRVLQAKRALSDRESQLRLLLASTAEAIYGLDLLGQCTFANTARLTILGYGNMDELRDQNMHNLIHHTRADGSPYPESDCRIYKAFRVDQGTHVDDEVLWRKDGTSFPAEYWSYPIREGAKLVGSVVTFLEISDRKQAEQEAKTLRNQLAHTSRVTATRFL